MKDGLGYAALQRPSGVGVPADAFCMPARGRLVVPCPSQRVPCPSRRVRVCSLVDDKGAIDHASGVWDRQPGLFEGDHLNPDYSAGLDDLPASAGEDEYGRRTDVHAWRSRIMLADDPEAMPFTSARRPFGTSQQVRGAWVPNAGLAYRLPQRDACLLAERMLAVQHNAR